jgi:two-component system chemotaxis sensor kinase CheA
LVHLDAILQLPAGARQARGARTHIAVLETGGKRFGLVVDEIRNSEEIVVKPLHRALSRIQYLSGATIMGDGQVALILDVSGLARRAEILEDAQTAAVAAPPAPTPRDPASCEHLVCEATDRRRIAVPVHDITRLEELPWAEVETLDGRQVIPYRGQILPLLDFASPVDEMDDAEHAPTIRLVVHTVGQQQVGLIVERILDVVPVAAAIDNSDCRPGLLGRALVDGQITSIVDIRGLAQDRGLRFDETTCRETAP